MPKPFAVLCHLVRNAGRLVTQDELLSAIWPNTYVQPEVLRRYILEIRRGLGDPGIGKTSLVDAFHRVSASSGVAVARGQSVEGFGGKEAYYPTCLQPVSYWMA